MTLRGMARYDGFYADYACTLAEAIVMMNRNGNGSVVLLKAKTPVAILTQSDLINLMDEEMDASFKAYEYATKLLVYINEHSSLEFAVHVLREHNIRRIVLVDDDQAFAGVILQEVLFDRMGEEIYEVSRQKAIDRAIDKRLEKEYLLMQQTKLATMGEMIGHIAHQWRQPLAQLGGLFMNLDAAYEFNELDRRYLKARIKEGNELIKYMSHTIEDFRNFFVPNRDKERFEIGRYVQSAVNIIQATLTFHGIELEVLTPETPIYFKGFPNEFSQVILNLLDNAKDVLVEREVTAPKITVACREAHGTVSVEVSDNGGGIAEADMAKIFDIYYSTKIKKGGSGLGLYISRLIIERKKMGTLRVSNGSEGAIFTIVLRYDHPKAT